jgi:hypothetical protein
MTIRISTRAALFGLCILSTALTAETLPSKSPITVQYSPSSITWSTAQQAEDYGLQLTVSGPDDWYTRHIFNPGQSAIFSTSGAEEGLLNDGSYTYELISVLVDGPTSSRSDGIQEISPSELIISGAFTVQDGNIVNALDTQEGTTTKASPVTGDLTVYNSLCVGSDCASTESFGFDTRIKFDDTSNSASFPNHDWQLTANDSANGGLNKFSIEDTTAGRVPFTIEGNAPTNSLYVDDGGRIGIKTSTPVVELHMVDGDTPTLRLEQNGSFGWSPQTWDVAGNETNFFIRDLTSGSRLPFRIRPGAPTNSIYIDTDGDVGMGTNAPLGALHVKRSGVVLNYTESSDGNAVQIRMRSDSSNRRFLATNNSDQVKSQILFGDEEIKFAGPTDSANLYATLNSTGLTVEGSISTSTSGLVHPDYVFEEKYELMPLQDLKEFVTNNKHLPEIPSADEVAKNGINITEMQIRLLKKVEELTLYIFEQDKKIEILQAQLDESQKL